LANKYGPADNALLASLPPADFKLLSPHLRTVSLDQGVLLAEAGDEVDTVHFPHTGMISLLAVMKDGRAVETSTVGSDGVVGAMAGLGLHVAMVRTVVQLPMSLSQVSAVQFRKAVAASETLRNLCIRYNEVLLAQSRITAGCNALHSLEARLCRWILQSRRYTDSDVVPLTQEFLAEMLGVRRTSVTDVAKSLQKEGLIHYSRGIIEIVSGKGITARACECHQAIGTATALLMRS
jgi:CRP-like cAMP-binding protein